MQEVQIRKFQENNKYKVICGKQIFESHNSGKPCNSFLIKNNWMLKVYSKIPLIKKKKILFNTCLKHTYVTFVSDESIPISKNKSLLLGDPLRNDFIVDIGNPNLMLSCHTNFFKERERFNKELSRIKFPILIKNTIATFDKMSVRITVNGSISGTDLRNHIDANLNLNKGTQYLLLLNTGKTFVPLRDDVSLLMLYEHFTFCEKKYICAQGCYIESKAPDKELEVYIKLDNRKLIEFKINDYSLKEKWINDEIPRWLMKLLADLYFEGPETRGIFRESASVQRIRSWINQIDSKKYFTIADKPLVKASILKIFIRGIKQGLFSKGYIGKHLDIFYFQRLTVEEFLSDENKTDDLIKDLMNLPKKNFCFLQNLLVVLGAIINNNTNNNTVYNISVLFNQSFFDNENELFKQEATLKLTETIIKLTDRLVGPSDKQKIIENFKSQSISNPYLDSSSSHLSYDESDGGIPFFQLELFPIRNEDYESSQNIQDRDSSETINYEYNHSSNLSLIKKNKRKNINARRATIAVCDSMVKYSNKPFRNNFFVYYSLGHRSRSSVQSVAKRSYYKFESHEDKALNNI